MVSFLIPWFVHVINESNFEIVDYNECAIFNGNCSQFCFNTIGSYMCSCQNGYALNADGRTCSGKGNNVLHLIIFNIFVIFRH